MAYLLTLSRGPSSNNCFFLRTCMIIKHESRTLHVWHMNSVTQNTNGLIAMSPIIATGYIHTTSCAASLGLQPNSLESIGPYNMSASRMHFHSMGARLMIIRSSNLGIPPKQGWPVIGPYMSRLSRECMMIRPVRGLTYNYV
jgi:hypothetical protein